MMCIISLQLITITSIIVLELCQFLSSLVQRVESCPSNELAWIERSTNFTCNIPKKVYHCLYNSEGTLVEICMKAYVINPYKVGCPWVKIVKGVSYLRSPFRKCGQTHAGCPEFPHKLYSSNELYKYPACFKNESKTAINTTNPITGVTTDANEYENQNNNNILIVCLVCFVIFILIAAFLFWKKFRHQHTDTLKNKENKTFTEPLCISVSNAGTVRENGDPSRESEFQSKNATMLDVEEGPQIRGESRRDESDDEGSPQMRWASRRSKRNKSYRCTAEF